MSKQSKLFLFILFFSSFCFPSFADITVSNLVTEDAGSERKVYGDIAFDSSYSSSGETFSLERIGCNRVSNVMFDEKDGYTFSYNYSANKIIVYRPGSPEYEGDKEMVEPPVIQLTSNANCLTNLAARPLEIVEHYGNGQRNVGRLVSNNNSRRDAVGRTAAGSVARSSRFASFWVSHVGDTGDLKGVPVYVSDSSTGPRIPHRLTFESPTGQDAFIVMPFEDTGGAVAGGASVPGFGVAVRVYHSSTASSDKPLAFDDNGARNAQLCYTDNVSSNNTLPASSIDILGPDYSDGRTLSAAPEIGSGTNLSQLTSVRFAAFCK